MYVYILYYSKISDPEDIYKIRHISWDSSDFFCPLTVFVSWHVRSKKINTGREGAQLFVRIWLQHGVFQLNVTRIVVLLEPRERKRHCQWTSL